MVNVGIVGFGKIAQRMYVPHIAAHPNAQLAAIADSHEGTREMAVSQFGIPLTFGDYHEMLDAVDAVCVCAPNSFHAPITIAALGQGKPVMVEKPMAMNLDEAQRMVTAAKKANTLLMVNQSQRFTPLFQRAKEVMDSGLIGDILGVRTIFGHSGPTWWSPESDWFFKKDVAGFGPIADLGIHRVDMVRHLTGMEFQEVYSAVSHMRKGQGDVEDNAVIVGKLTNGALASVTVSWTIHGRVEDTMDIFGSKGTLKIHSDEGRVLFADLDSPLSESSIEISVPEPYDNAYIQGEWHFFSGVSDFLTAIQEGKPCCVPGEEGLKSLEVVLAAAKAAEANQVVKLPL